MCQALFQLQPLMGDSYDPSHLTAEGTEAQRGPLSPAELGGATRLQTPALFYYGGLWLSPPMGD